MKMKRFETTSDSSLFASATQEDLLVSQILLGLENLFPLPIFIWGFRKRRSCLDAASCAPPLSVQIAEEDIDEVRRPLVEAEEQEQEDASTVAAAGSSSPATPLSFSPSESDGKFKPSSKKYSKKRSRADFNDEIEELFTHGDLLRVKVENMRKQYNKLKAQNSYLQAMKQEALETRQIKEEPQRDMGRFLNLGMDFIQHDETIMLPHRQPFVSDQPVHKLHHPFGPIRTQVYPPNNGLESVNRVGSPGIPDLNLTAEEGFGVESIMTDFDLFGDRPKPMEEDQVIGSTISSPETIHVSLTGQASSSSPSKSASASDVSPILPSMEGTFGAAKSNDEEKNSEAKDDAPSSSSSNDSDHSSQPDAIAERFDEVKNLLEKIRMLMVNFDARLLVSEYAVTNLCQVVHNDVNELKRKISHCMYEFKSSESKTNDALVILSDQITQMEQSLSARIDTVQASLGAQLQELLDYFHRDDAKKGKEQRRQEERFST